jgi:hypothetical protein
MEQRAIKNGDRVRFTSEFRSEHDPASFLAVEDEAFGKVMIEDDRPGFFARQRQTVLARFLEIVESK